jgi:hypothetical protein
MIGIPCDNDALALTDEPRNTQRQVNRLTAGTREQSHFPVRAETF